MSLASKLSPDAIYHHLTQVIATFPDLISDPTTTEAQRWLGKAHALIEVAGSLTEQVFFRGYLQALNSDARSRPGAAAEISGALYRLLAMAEIAAPSASAGAFISAGSVFDAMAAVARILAEAKNDVFIVDPYLDQKALSDYAATAPDLVMVRMLCDQRAISPTLGPAIQRWNLQYQGARPLEVRAAPAKSLHDRLILIDDRDVWLLTQSLKDLAVRSPASLQRSSPELSALKVDAYREMWSQSAELT